MFQLLLLLLSLVQGFSFYVNLDDPPRKDFKDWKSIHLLGHSKRQPNQPPSDWTNFTFSIPGYTSYAKAVQFTALSPYNTTNSTSAPYTQAEIPFCGYSNFFSRIYDLSRWTDGHENSCPSRRT